MRYNSKEHSRLLIFLCVFLTLLRLCNVEKILGSSAPPPPPSQHEILTRGSAPLSPPPAPLLHWLVSQAETILESRNERKLQRHTVA